MKNFFAFTLFLLLANSYGAITVDIYKQNVNAINIAVVEFEGDNKNLSSIIANNLKNSGKFNPKFIKDKNTKDKIFEAVIYGKVINKGSKYSVEVFLRDIWTGKVLFAKEIQTSVLSRKLAHHISDKIYFALLGERSAFETKISYVSISKNSILGKYKLIVADSDGENKQVLFSSSSPILSPTFSPDNNYIAYTAFSKNRSNVYIQNIYKDQIITLPNFDGIASSPAWHPKGKSLLVTLSKNDNQDIYLYTLGSGELTRITKHRGIDTEAAFSPDGKTIVWTSNRNGRPQLWQKTGNKISQISTGAGYNTSANFSADGKYIALVSGSSGSYQTSVYDIKDKDLIILSTNNNDESPSFAPNSKLVLSSDGDNLIITNITGTHILKLRDNDKMIEPTWSNF